MTDRPTTEDIAFAWAIRVAAPGFREWDAFLAWLDGDPTRNHAYNHAAAIVADATAVPSPRPESGAAYPHVPHADPVPDPAAIIPLRPRPRHWILATGGMAVAASIAAVLLVGRPAQTPSFRTIEAPGARMATVNLADGSRIDLAGGTRLHIGIDRPREVRIERGRAFFLVRHDEDVPFLVVAGAHRIVDVGTSFEVARLAGSVQVAVSTGKVVVDPERAALPLGPGKAADLDNGGSRHLYSLPVQAIGQWRFGRMSYRNAPLERVADDLSAALGHPVIVDRSLRMRRFDGTVTPATVREKPQDLAALLDVRVTAGTDGWRLHER